MCARSAAANDNGVLLIVTSSYDATVDFLLPFLPADRVFRFNTDLFQQYQLFFDASGFILTDPTGRSARSPQIYKAYWRWPDWPIAKGDEQRYLQAEARYIFQEMTNLLWSEGKFVLVEPGAPRRAGKLLQLMRAAEFLNVPPFQAGLNSHFRAQDGLQEVVKSLAKNLPADKFIFSTPVDPTRLAPNHAWFMQRYVQAVFDVTVVVVRHRLFAFKLARDFLETSIDWREVDDGKEDAWTPLALAENTCTAILRYMRAMRLDFGRLDFLMDATGQLHFCEVNPNPQYAWLDYDRAYGLLSAVLDEISPVTERHSIPFAHPLAEGTGGCLSVDRSDSDAACQSMGQPAAF
jgi:hypothetical protein